MEKEAIQYKTYLYVYILGDQTMNIIKWEMPVNKRKRQLWI